MSGIDNIEVGQVWHSPANAFYIVKEVHGDTVTFVMANCEDGPGFEHRSSMTYIEANGWYLVGQTKPTEAMVDRQVAQAALEAIEAKLCELDLDHFDVKLKIARKGRPEFVVSTRTSL